MRIFLGFSLRAEAFLGCLVFNTLDPVVQETLELTSVQCEKLTCIQYYVNIVVVVVVVVAVVFALVVVVGIIIADVVLTKKTRTQANNDTNDDSVLDAAGEG